MAITHVGTEFDSNFSGSNNSGDQNISVPSGTQEGDLMFMVSYGSTADMPISPGSWTLLDTVEVTGNGSTRCDVSYKFASSSEPSSYLVDSSNNTRGSSLSVFRGHDPTTPINDFGSADYTSNNPAEAPPVTTTRDNCKIITVRQSFSRFSTNEPRHTSSDTELADYGQDNGTGSRTCAVYLSGEKSAGFVSGLSVSMSGGALTFGIMFSIAIAPAPNNFVEDESDTVVLSDSVSIIHGLGHTETISDTVVLNDTPVGAQNTYTATVTDYLRLSDVVGEGEPEGETLTENQSDTSGLSDALSSTHSIVRSFSDTEGLSDTETSSTSTAYTEGASDTVGLSDTTSKTHSIVRSFTDTEDLSDSATSGATTAHTQVVADTVGLMDEVSRTHSIIRDFSDTEELSDSATAGASTALTQDEADTVGLSDSASSTTDYIRTVSDTVTLEEFIVGTGDLSLDQGDTLDLNDSVSVTGSFTRSFSDEIDLSDGSGQNISLSVSDTVDLSDSSTETKGVHLSLSDTLGLEDLISQTKSVERTLSDIVLLSGETTSTGSFVRSLGDILDISDGIVIEGAIPHPDDNVGLTDSFSYDLIQPSNQLGSYATTLVVGPADIYIADYESPEPEGLDILADPSAVYWTAFGSTLEGVSVEVAQEYEEIELVQVPTQPIRRLKRRRLAAKTVLAEPTVQNLLYAINSGTLDSGAGYTSYTPPEVDEATELPYRAVMLYGWAPGTDGNRHKRRVVIMRKCLSVDSVEFGYKKEDQTGLSITWAVHQVDSDTAPFKILEEE